MPGRKCSWLIYVFLSLPVQHGNGVEKNHHRRHKMRKVHPLNRKRKHLMKKGLARRELLEDAANKANAIEEKILRKKKTRQAPLNPDALNKKIRKPDPAQGMTDNYYFIQSCCMNDLPVNQACKSSLDKFTLVCKEHIGAHPGDCKKKASELYYTFCKKDGPSNNWPLFGHADLKGRRHHRMSRAMAMRQKWLKPEPLVPLEVAKGPHRIIW